MPNERRASRAGMGNFKKVTNLMGGDIDVESEKGKGSKFTITMPMVLKPPVEAAKG